MTPTLIEAKNLCVRFPKLTALQNFSMSVASGQLVGLIGPNGAGKTTLLRTLCGLQRPSAGEVHIMGAPLHTSVEALSHIGFTPDTPPLYELMTVRTFLRFIGRGYRLAPAEVDERVAFWLEQLWLSEKADVQIKTLSRGMKQRIGIVRTMLPDPQIVLLDEPAAGLDPAGRAEFRRFLVTLREMGKAIIVSSHILADMGQYCSHIAIMSGGEMVRHDTVAGIAHGAAAERCRYTLGLAAPVAGIETQLQQIDGVEVLLQERDRVEIEFKADREAAAVLLGELIRLRLPVCSFAPAAVDIEEAYLRAGIRQVD